MNSIRAASVRASFVRAFGVALVSGLVACGGSDSGSASGAKGASETSTGDTALAATFHVTDEQRSRLEILTVNESSYQSMIEATGTVAFNGDHSTQVISPISGPVARLVANLGSNVTAGQTLATVSSPDFAAAVADYRKAEFNARNATRILDRNEQLFKNDALARSDLDQSRTDAASAAADRDAAEQQLRSLGLDADVVAAIRAGTTPSALEAAIRAPIPGTVVEKLINPGQLLQAGTTAAFTIADVSTMWVMVSVYNSDVGELHAGDAVEVVTDDEAKPIEAKIDYIAPIVDPATRATSVRVLAPNPQQRLKRDLFVRVRLHSARAHKGVVLPSTAVLRDDDNLPFVFVANADKSFSRRRITLGSAVKDGYAILDGVKPGEKVLGNGALFVQFAEHQ